MSLEARSLGVAFVILLGCQGGVPAVGASLVIPVHGEILDSSGPLQGVSVVLLPILSEHEDGLLLLRGTEHSPPVALSRSDGQGRFRLMAPGPGMWRVRAAKDGFAAMALDLVPLLEERDLPPVRLPRADEMEVRVESQTGQPISGARIFVSGEPTMGSRSGVPQPTWNPARLVVTTDARGGASISVAAEGARRVEIAARGFESRIDERIHGRHWSARLRPVPVHTIVVIDRELRGVEDILLYSVGAELPLGRTDETGRVEVWSALGDGRLRLLAADGAALETSIPPPRSLELRATRLQLDGPRILQGRVIGLPHRDPIAGALVWREGAPDGAVRADERGSYRLPLLPWHEGALRVAAPGHLPEQIAWDTPITGTEGPTFVLQPVGTITGLIMDREGRPLPGAEIRTRFDRRSLGPRQINPPYWQRQSGGVARSRKDGRFRLGNLIPGLAYELRVELDGFSPERVSISVPRPGEPGRDMRIALDRGIRAGGLVLDPQERPVAGASVTLTESKPPDVLDQIRRLEDPPPTLGTTTDSAGRFEIKALPAGELDLEVEAQGFASVTVPRIELPAEAGEERVDLGTIIMAPEAVVSGRVEDTEGKPLAGAAVTIVPDNPYLALAQDRFPPEPDALSASDGTFEVGGLRPDQSVKLRVDLEGYALRVIPAVQGGEKPVTVVLSRARVLVGTVVDPGKTPVADALVLLSELDHVKVSGGQIVSASKPTSLFGRTDDDGRFRIEGVDPGPIDVVVDASGWQRWERRVDPWSDGQKGDLEIVLQAAAVIAGVVLDAGRQPAIGAEVRTWEPEAPAGGINYRAPLATTDGDGAYRIDDLAPGPVRLEARHAALGRAVREIEALVGENLVDFQLRAAARVSGRVVDWHGAPVGEARVVVRSQLASWVPPRVESDGAGYFEIVGLSKGIYALEATKEGLGRSVQPLAFELREESLDELVVEIAPTGTVAGPLLDVGAVDHEGRYRIPGLSPGTWTIVAEIPRTGRQATGRIELGTEHPEARLDLDFGTGLTLTGTISARGEPWPGATVTAFGPGGVAAWTQADGSGRFRISGLEEGDYVVEVVDLDRDLHYQQPVRLDSDRTIHIDLNVAAGSGIVPGGKRAGG